MYTNEIHETYGRLRNEVQDNQFSYTLGAGGISTGSKCVMTININRLVQETFANHPELDRENFWNKNTEQNLDIINRALAEQVTRVHNYLKAFNTILLDRYKAGLLPLYDAGFVNPKRQFLTIGVNGCVEAAEFLNCKIKPDDNCYKQFVNSILQTIHKLNVEHRTEDCMFNTEFVPKMLGTLNLF